jgi:hypothetical protein
MLYEVLQSTDAQLSFATAPRARIGRALLYAILPWLAYLLLLTAGFALAIFELISWISLRQLAIFGAVFAAALAGIGFALGLRIRHEIEATRQHLSIRRHPAWGQPDERRLAVLDLTALAIDPSLRSLGADLLLVAVSRTGQRIAVAEGDPHSGELRELAQQASAITGLPMEPPKFTRD